MGKLRKTKNSEKVKGDPVFELKKPQERSQVRKCQLCSGDMGFMTIATYEEIHFHCDQHLCISKCSSCQAELSVDSLRPVERMAGNSYRAFFAVLFLLVFSGCKPKRIGDFGIMAFKPSPVMLHMRMVR